MVLYVVFDSRCGLCRELRQWLEAQPAWMELRFLAAGSAEAQRLFPAISVAGEELLVISEQGEVYGGNQGWIMCLWALVEYRELACKLSTPLLLPLARSAFAAISQRRNEISEWLRLESSEQTIAEGLSQNRVDGCVIGGPGSKEHS